MRVHDYAQPFTAGDGDVAVLFCHGFTASPGTLRPWADEVAAAGFTVCVPRLPGHGTTWQELAVTGWEDWYACLDREYRRLRERHEQIFVAGMSMGGALSLRLLEEHVGDQFPGLILVNPALVGPPRTRLAGLLRYVITSTDGRDADVADPRVIEHSYPRTPVAAVESMTRMWVDVCSRLDLISCPLLIFRSDHDHVISIQSLDILLKQVSSEDITTRMLPRSFHVATRDYDRGQITSESIAFLRRHSVSHATH